jgi:capping protein beta
LIGDDKAALHSFRHKQWLPLEPFTSIPPAEEGETEEKPFLKCAYTTSEKGGFRSPWTNRFYLVKKSASGIDIDIYEKPVPPQEQDVRDIESAANEVWAAYTHLYYGKDAVGSVFLKPRDKTGTFEGLFGVHKRTSDNGIWDSVHLVQVDEPNEEEATCTYRVDSAVVMSLCPYEKSTISSSLTKETVKTCNIRFTGVTGSHLENIGTIIEDIEIDFRSRMERVAIPKTMDVVESIYRKTMVGSAVHLIKERTSMASGNVGASMIGEIVSAAQKKRSSAVMAAMELSEKKRENNEKVAVEKDATGGMLFDFKKTLKVTAPKPKPDVGSTPTPEFLNFRNQLKKTGSRK